MARESSQPGLSDQVGRPRLPEGVCEHEVDGLGGAAAGRGDDVDGHVHGHRPGGGGGGGRGLGSYQLVLRKNMPRKVIAKVR